MASGSMTAWQIEGKNVEVVTFSLLGLQNHCGWCDFHHLSSTMKSEDDCFLAGEWWQTRRCVEKQRHYSADKGRYSQGHGLPSGRIQLWELDRKEDRMPKNWCLWTVVLEKISESPLDSKEIKPVNLQGDQPWYSLEGLMLKLKLQWSSDVNRWFIGKGPDFGKDWGQKENRASEDEMAGRCHQCSEHELGQRLGDGEGQRGLACCSPWGQKELDMTGWLNNIFYIRKTPLLFPAAICRIAQSFS